MDPDKMGLVLGIVLGIIIIWFGFLLALVSLPLARGEVRSRDYNYRPFRKYGERVFGITADIEDAVNKKVAKWMVVFGIFMAAMGFCSIIFGILSLGNPLITYLLVIVLLVIFMIGAFAYAISLGRRERRNAH